MVVKLRKWVKVVLWLVLLLLLIVVIKSGTDTYNKVMYPLKYEDLVNRYAAEYQVDKNLIYAVIKTESGFDPEAVSENNAKGLMQITEDTFDWIGTKIGGDAKSLYVHDDMYQPEISIMYGAFLLSYLVNEFGDYQVVLSAYHAGRGAANEWLKNAEYSADGKTLSTIPYPDTNHYVSKVMKSYDKYVRLYGAAL